MPNGDLVRLNTTSDNTHERPNDDSVSLRTLLLNFIDSFQLYCFNSAALLRKLERAERGEWREELPFGILEVVPDSLYPTSLPYTHHDSNRHIIISSTLQTN